MFIESVMPSNHLVLCFPLLLLPSISPSIMVFFNESALCIMWPKYWSFGFSISPSNEHSRLISFRFNWVNLFAVQGTLKHLLQHHSSKVSVLWCSAFFMVLKYIFFSNAWKWKVKVKSLSHVRFLVTPWTTAHQAPPSMGFSRQEYWSGLPLPSPRL